MKVHFQEKLVRFFLCKTLPWKGKGSAQPIPKGAQKKALPISMKVHFQENLVRFLLCKTFPWKGKGSAQPIPKGSQKKALPISMKIYFQEKRRVHFFVRVVLIIMSSRFLILLYCCPVKIMKRFKNNISPDSRLCLVSYSPF